jgi:adenylate cyclase class 1
VVLNSWNELQVSRYDGADALLDCLRDLLNSLPPGSALPRVQVRCYCRNRAQPIAERVEELLRDLLDSYAEGYPSRYLVQVRQHYHVLQLAPGQVSHTALGDLPALLAHLGAEQALYSPLGLDRHALEGDDLALILPMGRPQCLQVFYRVHESSGEAELTLLDEHNALWRRRLPFRDEQSLLTPIHRFLQSLLYRRNAMLPLEGADSQPALEILYYQLLPAAPLRAQRLERRPAPESQVSHPFYDVQAIVEPGDGRQRHVTLYCNHREFSELEYGRELYRAVAQHIIVQRAGGERYPCYITDLDLSAVLAGQRAQTVHFLRYKSELENALNTALQQA